MGSPISRNSSSEDLLGTQEQKNPLSGLKKLFIGCGRKISKMPEKNPRMVRALKYSAIAAGILALLGGGLLLYMHFGGLGVDKAGFAKLGHQISEIWTKFAKVTHLNDASHLTVGEVIGIGIGGGVAGAITLFGMKKLNDKISERREQRREQRLEDPSRRDIQPRVDPTKTFHDSGFQRIHQDAWDKLNFDKNQVSERGTGAAETSVEEDSDSNF